VIEPRRHARLVEEHGEELAVLDEVGPAPDIVAERRLRA
jgi:hypothetical protein